MDNSKCSTANIVMYVLCGLTILLVLYCLFKVFNISRKINSVSDFMNGEVFSSKFHSILSNYFADEKHTKLLLEPLMPWIREVIFAECKTVDCVESKPKITDFDGTLFLG
jgi:hypothetical protein